MAFYTDLVLEKIYRSKVAGFAACTISHPSNLTPSAWSQDVAERMRTTVKSLLSLNPDVEAHFVMGECMFKGGSIFG